MFIFFSRIKYLFLQIRNSKIGQEFEVRTTGEYKIVVIANFLYQGVEYKIEDQKIINIISPDKYGLDGCYRGTVIYTSKKDSKDNLDCVHFNLKSYGEEGYYKEKLKNKKEIIEEYGLNSYFINDKKSEKLVDYALI